MTAKVIIIIVLINIFGIYWTDSAKPCALRQIPGADGVCVCNATYCDEFPPLQAPAPGHALVYESGKSGHRFKESVLKVETQPNPEADPQSVTITLDKSQTYQKIIGFGGSFTDLTGWSLNSLPKALSDNIMNSYFSKNGIEYNMGRVPIGANDYSFKYYTYDDVANDKSLSHFALAKEDHELKIPHIKHAMSLSTHPVNLFGSPWLAPEWVRTNITTNQLRGEPGGEYYQIWANYLVKFLDSYKAENVPIWGLTVQNEPTLGRKFPGNGLYYDEHMTLEMVRRNLGPALHKAGYTPDKFNLMIFDDNAQEIVKWSHTILGDKEAGKYVQGVAYHWYGSSRTSDYPNNLLDETHKAYPDRFLLMTEACHLEGMGNGRWDFGEHYAHDIIRDINYWTNGWVEWNMVLALNGCPRCNEKEFSSAVQVDIVKKEAFKQPAFYTIGHFSKFLPPNTVRVGHKLDKNVSNLFVLTMKRPDNATVVVVLNQNNSTINLKITDNKNHISHIIPERSIQTYIWW